MPNLPSTAISRLLEQLSELDDPRQRAKVIYSLPEIISIYTTVPEKWHAVG